MRSCLNGGLEIGFTIGIVRDIVTTSLRSAAQILSLAAYFREF